LSYGKEFHMIAIRKSDERGHFQHGWLDTYHTFSFADYYDPQFMGFRSLRVMNEDRVQPGRGFGTHGHRDMEILSYVLEGGLAHRDSIGNSGVIRPGDVQRMSAGTGVMHSEANASEGEPVHFLQIWILPEGSSSRPGYEQKTFSDDDKRGKLRLVASRDGRDGTVKIQQDVNVYAAVLDPGQEVLFNLNEGRHAWLQVARGQVELNGEVLRQGDGAAISEERELRILGNGSEVLLFDLA
jgi:redox-sensitive bicupin YhaK (pirin superfamily)